MAQNDDVQGITLKPTEADIREMCGITKVPFAGLVAIWRRHRQIDDSIQLGDTLYMMALAKSKNLNPLDDIYALIPRPGGKGFSLTFTKAAALQVITKHPAVKQGTMKRWFVSGKGETIPWGRSPAWRTLQEIDWDLEAHITVESVDGALLEGVAKYGNVFAAGQDRNPKFLWMKDAGGMTMKQAYKDLANTQFGGGLPDEEEAINAIETTATVQQSLPAQGESGQETEKTQTVFTTAKPSQEPPKEDFSGLIEKAKALGINAAQIVAAFEGQEKNGVTLAAFEADLQKKIDVRAKAAANPTRTRRAAKAADAPKAEAPAKPKKEPKPRISIVGVIDAIGEKSKAFPRKEGEPEKPGQRFLVISINQMDMTVWHESMFDGMFEAMEAKPQKRVKVGYTTSQTKDDPPREFYEVEEFEILDDAILAPVVPEPGDMSATPEESFAMETEYVDPADSKCEECGSSFDIHLKTCSHFVDPHAKQKANDGAGSAAPSSGSLLFNF